MCIRDRVVQGQVSCLINWILHGYLYSVCTSYTRCLPITIPRRSFCESIYQIKRFKRKGAPEGLSGQSSYYCTQIFIEVTPKNLCLPVKSVRTKCCCSLRGKVAIKRRTFFRHSFSGNEPSVHLHDFFANSQTNTRTSVMVIFMEL